MNTDTYIKIGVMMKVCPADLELGFSKNYFFVCMQSQNLKKNFILKFKMISRGDLGQGPLSSVGPVARWSSATEVRVTNP